MSEQTERYEKEVGSKGSNIGLLSQATSASFS
jgi:hypothetical protein